MCISSFKNWKINTLSSKIYKLSKAKFSHFDRTRWDKNQIFRTKADDNQCYKIKTIPLTNNEAAGFCNQEGAELLQVESADEDNVINEILFGLPEYSTPTHPGFYHIGTYQKQTANQYYHRNGVRV